MSDNSNDESLFLDMSADEMPPSYLNMVAGGGRGGGEGDVDEDDDVDDLISIGSVQSEQRRYSYLNMEFHDEGGGGDEQVVVLESLLDDISVSSIPRSLLPDCTNRNHPMMTASLLDGTTTTGTRPSTSTISCSDGGGSSGLVGGLVGAYNFESPDSSVLLGLGAASAIDIDDTAAHVTTPPPSHYYYNGNVNLPASVSKALPQQQQQQQQQQLLDGIDNSVLFGIKHLYV